jgi:hypothetical protein
MPEFMQQFVTNTVTTQAEIEQLELDAIINE